ncbi:MAG: hypothetical protein Q9214_002492, partial [Letrouitia sp. 1 TL-2023]
NERPPEYPRLARKADTDSSLSRSQEESVEYAQLACQLSIRTNIPSTMELRMSRCSRQGVRTVFLNEPPRPAERRSIEIV